MSNLSIMENRHIVSAHTGQAIYFKSNATFNSRLSLTSTTGPHTRFKIIFDRRHKMCYVRSVATGFDLLIQSDRAYPPAASRNKWCAVMKQNQKNTGFFYLASPNLKAWLCVTKGKSSYSDKGYEVGTTRESKNIQLLWRLVKEPPKPVQPAPKKPVPPPKKPAPPPKKPAPPPKKPAPPPKEDSDSDIPSDEVDSDEEYGPKRPTRASSSSSDEEFGPKRPGTHTKASGAGPSMTGASQYGPSVPKPNYFGGGPKVTPASNSGPSIPQPDPSLLDKGPNPKPAAKKAPGVKKKPTGSNAKGKKKRKHGLNSKG